MKYDYSHPESLQPLRMARLLAAGLKSVENSLINCFREEGHDTGNLLKTFVHNKVILKLCVEKYSVGIKTIICQQLFPF